MKILLLMILSLPFFGEASNLSAPFAMESTGVLPKKIRSPRFKNIMMMAEEKYDNSGGMVGLGSALNKNVTWADVIAAKSLEADKVKVKASIDAAGVADQEGPGKARGDVNTFIDVKVPVLSMGITDDVTMALAVPIYRVDVKAELGFEQSQAGKTWQDSICQKDPTSCEDASVKLNSGANSKLERKGYQPIRSETISGIGDIKLIRKQRLYKNDKDALAWTQTLTFPTGSSPNADKAVDVTTGDGQWDIGVGVIYDRFFKSQLWLNTYANYTAQLPDELDRRIPDAQDDPTSADKEKVWRDSGDVLSVGAAMNYGLGSSGFFGGVGYNYQYMSATHFRGSGNYAPERYQWLEDQYPLQDMHSGIVSFGYSTIDAYKEGKFVIPMQGNVSLSRPFAGRNVSTTAVVSAELVMFF